MTEQTSKKNVRLRTIILIVAIVVLARLWKSGTVGPSDEILDANSDEAVILNGGPKVQICINNGGKRNTTKGVCELEGVDNNADTPTDEDTKNNEEQPADDENAALSGDTTLTGGGSMSGEAKLELDINNPEEEPNPDPQPNAGFGIKAQ